MDKNKDIQTKIEAASQEGALLDTVAEIDFDQLEVAGSALADLHREGTTDGLAYFESLSWSELSSRDQMRNLIVLKSFLSALQAQAERISSFIHAVASDIHQHNIYHLQNGFQNWASANGDQLPILANLISARSEDSPFLTPLLHAWWENAPEDALTAANTFCDDARPQIRQDAIFALGAFKYDRVESAGPATAKLSALLDSQTDQARLSAIAASARLLDQLAAPVDELTAKLEALCKDPDPETRHALIAVHVHNKSAFPEHLQHAVFALMKTVTADCPGTLDRIDFALYDMDLDEDRETVFDIVSALLTQEEDQPSLEAFGSLTHKIETADHSLLCWYVTRWLLSGDFRICTQLSALFPPLNRSPYDFDLSAFSLTPAEVFYLARKIYVYLMFDHGAGVSLLIACLMALKLDHRKQLEANIASFWLRNFPGDIEIFETAIEVTPRKGLKASVTRLKAHIDTYETPLQTLSKNPALRPSTMERRIQAELARERGRDVGRMAMKKSILGDLVHTSHLLYGRTSVTYVYRGEGEEPIRQIIPMQSFQTSTPLPKMDVLYPTRLNFLLYRFRREKRPT
ncbi:MAG: hypothetical protein CME88_16970 [Hirschia sp.]|nr:hypothetical protein [Hirschia sp.]MBF20069.1 hypothetical protein [Hirschia sp.]